MEEKKKVLLGMSGGVDSSTAALLLQKAGYEVVGVTMKLWKNKKNAEDASSSDNEKDAKAVCDKLGIDHYVVDFKEDFKKYVIDDFICNYKNCKTPNPCIMCNKHLKFDLMFRKAKELGIDYIATGHYAKTEYSDEYGRYVIKRARSEKKDQSYVLYNIPKEKVEHTLFPLADFENKDEIRKIAEEAGLINARKADSQDICFIPDGDYITFLRENSDIEEKEGNIVTKEGEIVGKHKGLISYTIGQRKGLGIGGGKVYYVIKLDSERNEVVVGSEEDLYTDYCKATNVNLILFDKLESATRVNVKIRYAAKPVPATISMNEDGVSIDVRFTSPAKSVTPGQSIVFYTDDGIVIGGGIIE